MEWLGYPTEVVVGEYHGGGIDLHESLNNDSSVISCAIDGSEKEFFKSEYPMSVIKKYDAELMNIRIF